MQKTIAFFDFDGTITRKDTLLDFLIFAFGYFKVIVGFMNLMPVLLGFYLGFLKNDYAKVKIIKYFLKGHSLSNIQKVAISYVEKKLPLVLRSKAIDRMMWHIDNRHEVIVVSASPSLWIEPWTVIMKIGLVSTILETKNDKFTGNFKTKNCYGVEKVKRIKNILNLDEYETIYAYGDSSGDHEMLNLANFSYYKPFR